jgi:aspartate aminotransferase
MQTIEKLDALRDSPADVAAPVSSRMHSTVARAIVDRYHNGSEIRKMFDDGVRLKTIHGPDNVADLSIGNPPFPPPAAFTRALQQFASARGRHSYMQNAGFLDVREAVARSLNERGFFNAIEGQHIVMTTGAAGAINVVLKTILEPGDEVIVPRPFFSEYRYYIDNHGGRMVLADTGPAFDLDVAAILEKVTASTRAVIVNSPCNPTGRVYPETTLQALADNLKRLSDQRGSPIFVISDEPYRELLFDNARFTSIASLYCNSFMCYSWSKAFSIAGERIGYIAVNPTLRTDDWPTLIGSLAMCNRFLGFVNAPAFMQRVIGAALNAPPETDHYARRRTLLCQALDEGGYRYARPEGTFYIFPETPGTEDDFIRRAREELLLVVPGRAFGAEGWFRLSFAATDRAVELACERLVRLSR